MPTFETQARFDRDFGTLTGPQQRRFRGSLVTFIAALAGQHDLPAGLRVKRVQGEPGVWEMTWAPDGRATFEYGDEVRPGEPQVIWRRVGTHAILERP